MNNMLAAEPLLDEFSRTPQAPQSADKKETPLRAATIEERVIVNLEDECEMSREEYLSILPHTD